MQLGLSHQHGFHSHNRAFAVHCISKSGYPNEEHSYTALRVLYCFDITTPHVLGQAKDDIYSFLRQNKVHEVEVEIVHTDNCFSHSLFPICPDD